MTLRTVDFFAGGGGLSLGFQQAGFDVVCAVENWQPALDVYRANFTDHDAISLDLSDEYETLRLLDNYKPDIVIGGPPCQAYSLVGRARNRGKQDYVAENDPKHYLYRHYIEILGRLRPAAFVMENVKGMLSSSVDGSPIFGRVLEDLRDAAGRDSYTLLALSPRKQTSGEPSPSDFILRSEDFGVPQARHRVIVVGLRNDIAERIGERALSETRLMPHPHRVRVCDVLDGMPALRSGLSRGQDSLPAWNAEFENAAQAVLLSSAGLPEAVRLK